MSARKEDIKLATREGFNSAWRIVAQADHQLAGTGIANNVVSGPEPEFLGLCNLLDGESLRDQRLRPHYPEFAF